VEEQVTPEQARQLAEEAYIYGFAIVENYKAMYGMAIAEGSPVFSGFNRYLHGRQLFDADYTTVVNANNDTLYSTAFADLRAEPIVLTVPPTGTRYFVVQLVDMSTDNFAYIGTRATGNAGGDYLLLGPSFRGDVPHGPWTGVIAAPSEFIALATRTAIAGADDLDGVIAVQEGLRVRALSEFRATDPPAAPAAVRFPPYDPAAHGTPGLFETLNFLLRFHHSSPTDDELLARVSELGIGPYQRFALDRFDPATQRAIEEGAESGQQKIEDRGNHLGSVVQGWQDIPRMGNYEPTISSVPPWPGSSFTPTRRKRPSTRSPRPTRPATTWMANTAMNFTSTPARFRPSTPSGQSRCMTL
jgi:hypothetical protein